MMADTKPASIFVLYERTLLGERAFSYANVDGICSDTSLREIKLAAIGLMGSSAANT
jgi:hypothetical protein